MLARLRILAVVAILMICAVSTGGQNNFTGAGGEKKIPAENFVNLPLSFEPNRGQTDPRVRFLSRGKGYSLFLTDQEAVLELSRDRSSDGAAHFEEDQKETDVVRMRLQGAWKGLIVSGSGEMAGTTNYFIGDDPAKWHSGIPTYAKVKYTGVYPGIDLVYYGNQQQLEYDFVVAPGADPTSIRLQFAGAEKLSLTENGSLTVASRHANIAMHKPVVYQVRNGRRQPVEGQFLLAGEHSVGFKVAVYDHSQPLIICVIHAGQFV